MEESITTLTSYAYDANFQSKHSSPTPSQIHVRNLSFPAFVGADPWSRPRAQQNIYQPVLLSARVALRQPFATASATDTVDTSTVHYGILAKQILKVVSSRGMNTGTTFRSDWSLNDMIDWLCIYLTGVCCKDANTNAREAVAAAGRYEIEGGIPCVEKDARYKQALIRSADLRELEFQIYLAKGSLKSTGVRLIKKIGFSENGNHVCSSILRLEGMRIPTLIGVNDNERTAKQIVIASVEIDPYVCLGRDCYPELEDIVFRTIEDSSFETLETLAIHVADRIIDLFLRYYVPSNPRHRRAEDTEPLEASTTPSHIKICLEKPTAVTFADAPMIEIVKVFNPADPVHGRIPPKVPFPIPQGSLEEWLECH